jgi:ubiquinone/menaquinone biosynthesis C-methylase UbiE
VPALPVPKREMTEAEVDQALLDAARLEPEEDVLVLGGGALALGAHDRVGDGWVYVVRSQVAELEELLGEAHEVGAAGVAYLVGDAPVLPLPDAAVVAAVGRIATEDGALVGATEELARVLAAGGRIAFAEPDSAAGEELARSLSAAGFEELEVTSAGTEAVVSGRLG